jgi:hypothetical protein
MAEPTTLQSLEGMITRLSGENSYSRRKKQKEVVDEATEKAQKRFAERLASIRDDDPQREALKKAAYSGGTLFGDWAMKKWKGKKDKEETVASDADDYDRIKTEFLSNPIKDPNTAALLSKIAPFYETDSAVDRMQKTYNDVVLLGKIGTTDMKGKALSWEKQSEFLDNLLFEAQDKLDYNEVARIEAEKQRRFNIFQNEQNQPVTDPSSVYSEVGTTEPLDAGFQSVEEQQGSLEFDPQYASTTGSGRNTQNEILPEGSSSLFNFSGLFDNDKKRKPSGRNR